MVVCVPSSLRLWRLELFALRGSMPELSVMGGRRRVLRDCEFIGQSQPPMTPRHAMDVDRCEKYVNRRKISLNLFLQLKNLKQTTNNNWICKCFKPPYCTRIRFMASVCNFVKVLNCVTYSIEFHKNLWSNDIIK